MEILNKITNILSYPSWFGYVFGTMTILICFGLYLKYTWHDTDKGERTLIVVALVCLAIGIVNIPLKAIVKVNASKYDNETQSYDVITEYSKLLYETDNSDEALDLLAADLVYLVEYTDSNIENETEEVPEPTPVTATYILNTNTKKFHYPFCPSVDEIKESNKQEFTGTRDEILSLGYDPCGRCTP